MLHHLSRAARFLAIALTALLVTACSGSEEEAAAPKTEFNIGWSIYAGWMPWPYAEQAGIVKKWGDKYGITIKFVQVNDYIESVNQYTAGKLDGVTVANMDALTIPAAGGKDTSAIILGDYSNGNDAVLLKGASNVAAIKGREVYLVELSVSHYLLARALEKNGMKLTAFIEDEAIYSKTYYSIGGGFIVDEESFGKADSGDMTVNYPFKSAAELLAHCGQTGLSISALMLENEKCFNTPEEIYKKLGKIWTTMREGIERGCRTEGILAGPLRFFAAPRNLPRRDPADDRPEPRAFACSPSLWRQINGEIKPNYVA